MTFRRLVRSSWMQNMPKGDGPSTSRELIIPNDCDEIKMHNAKNTCPTDANECETSLDRKSKQLLLKILIEMNAS